MLNSWLIQLVVQVFVLACPIFTTKQAAIIPKISVRFNMAKITFVLLKPKALVFSGFGRLRA